MASKQSNTTGRTWFSALDLIGPTQPHPMKDWSPRLRMNAAACVKARQDYDTEAEAHYEIHGRRLPSFDDLSREQKHRLTEAEFQRMQRAQTTVLAFPAPAAVGVSAYLADAQEALDDMIAALQDALRAVPVSDPQTALRIGTLLEATASAAVVLCQTRTEWTR